MEEKEVIHTENTEVVKVRKSELTQLLTERKELQQTVIHSTDIILLFIQMIGGKLPTSKMEVALLIGKLPRIIESLSNQDKVKYMQKAIEKIIEIAPQYITAEQVEKLVELNLIPKKEIE